MKILYVTDLHGDKKKYRKILDVAIEKEIKVIVNGGDMLPKQCDRHSEQSFFINGFLDEYFEELKKQDLPGARNAVSMIFQNRITAYV